MNIHRVLSLFKRDLKSFTNGKWKWIEVFYFPVTSVIIWGLFSLWGQELGTNVGKVVVIINIFWSYVFVVQSSANYPINEDMWGHSGRSIFAAGVTGWEYIIAHCLFSLIISLPALIIIMFCAWGLFDLNFMILFPLPTLHLILLTIMTGITWAMIIGALLFLTGRELGFITWSLFQLFIMLSFPLFPVELLPTIFQGIAYIMPLTAIFNSVRDLALGEPLYLGQAWLVTGIYLILGIIFYHVAVRYARRTGKIMKNF